MTSGYQSRMIGTKDGGMVKAMYLFSKRIRLILLMDINMLLSIRKEAVIQQTQQQANARR